LNWKPNKWIAAVLGFVTGPIGLLYAGFPILATAIALLLIAAVPFSTAWSWSQSQNGIVIFKIVFGIASSTLCFLLAVRSAPHAQRPAYTRWYGLIVGGVILTALVGLFRVFFYETYAAASTSMAPSAYGGRILLVKKFGYAPLTAFSLNFGSTGAFRMAERGDIVAFIPPERRDQIWVKRVVGLPGDTITYRDRHLFVNGVDTRGAKRPDFLDDDTLTFLARYEEKIGTRVYDILLREQAREFPQPDAFPFRDRCTYRDDEIACVVPPGNYYLLGDNRDNSLDSRTFGFVRADAIVGKVVEGSHDRM